MFLPFVAIRWFGHPARNPARVVMFVKIAHQCAVGEFKLFFLTQPAAEFGDRPVGLICQRRIIHKREDFGGDLIFWQMRGLPGFRPVDKSVDALFIESRNPETQCPLVNSTVAQNQMICSAKEKR